MTDFNKKIVDVNYNIDESFFEAAPLPKDSVSATGIYATFFDNRSSAEAFAAYLGEDLGGDNLVPVEDYRNERAGNGMGFGGTFVRFRAKAHTIAEIRDYMAKLP